MGVKKSETSKKLLANNAPDQPASANEIAAPEAEFVPLQNIATSDTPSQTANSVEEKRPFEDTSEKPFLLYEKGNKEKHPILNVRKPAFTPSVKERDKKPAQKVRIELPE